MYFIKMKAMYKKYLLVTTMYPVYASTYRDRILSHSVVIQVDSPHFEYDLSFTDKMKKLRRISLHRKHYPEAFIKSFSRLIPDLLYNKRAKLTGTLEAFCRPSDVIFA